MPLERAQHRVLAARQLGRDLVGQLDLRPHAPSARTHQRRDALAVGASVDGRHRALHRDAHLLRRAGAAVGHRLLDDRLQLGVGELGRQVGGDQLGLGLLAGGQVLATALTESPRRLDAALALAPQHRQLVAVALLGGLLQLGEHQPQRARRAASRRRASRP